MSAHRPSLDLRAPDSIQTSIVLVHGAIVNGWEMGLLRHRLRRLGYRVRQFHYHSMLCGLEENAGLLGKFIAETEGEVVHVIGHSMGGVLTRYVFERTPDSRPGRIIAIGSPLLDCWVGRRVNRLHGRIGRHLIGRTLFDHLAHPPDPVWRGSRDFGVLAGTYPVGIGAVFPSLPRPSDGVVLLEETQLQGIRDHKTIKLNHFGMLLSRRCWVYIARFLASGLFMPGRRTAVEGEVAEVVGPVT